MLRDYHGQNCAGWLASEKLDGWRVMWDGENFYSRELGLLGVPEWFKAGMPTVALDGELFAGRGKFNAIQGLIREGWHGLTFQVFDAPGPGTFTARLRTLKSLSLPSHCAVVNFHKVNDAAQVWTEANAICDNGGEGLVVRDPKGKYLFGQRSDQVLRMVPQCPSVNRKSA